jgi:hypothetical protein
MALDAPRTSWRGTSATPSTLSPHPRSSSFTTSLRRCREGLSTWKGGGGFGGGMGGGGGGRGWRRVSACGGVGSAEGAAQEWLSAGAPRGGRAETEGSAPRARGRQRGTRRSPPLWRGAPRTPQRALRASDVQLAGGRRGAPARPASPRSRARRPRGGGRAPRRKRPELARSRARVPTRDLPVRLPPPFPPKPQPTTFRTLITPIKTHQQRAGLVALGAIGRPHIHVRSAPAAAVDGAPRAACAPPPLYTHGYPSATCKTPNPRDSSPPTNHKFPKTHQHREGLVVIGVVGARTSACGVRPRLL